MQTIKSEKESITEEESSLTESFQKLNVKKNYNFSYDRTKEDEFYQNLN